MRTAREVILPRKRPPARGDVGGRERVLRAALRLFATKGYAATTVRDILRAAGVTAPVLYYHFGSKEGVFLALAREGAQRFDAALEKALRPAGTAEERIRGYCRASATVRREHPNLARIVERILSGPPKAAPRFDLHGAIASSVRRLEELVREGTEREEFRRCDPRDAALALLGAVEITTRSHIFRALIPDPQDQLEGMLSVILLGLKAPSPPRSAPRR